DRGDGGLFAPRYREGPPGARGGAVEHSGADRSPHGRGLDRLFADGRKAVSEDFVPVDVKKVVAARVGSKKPPLKVLWARYLKSGDVPGARFYGYDRFCEIVTEHVRTRDLTAAI